MSIFPGSGLPVVPLRRVEVRCMGYNCGGVIAYSVRLVSEALHIFLASSYKIERIDYLRVHVPLEATCL